MTYILQHDDDILRWEEFESEESARQWAEDHILRSEIRDWTLMDPEGGTWSL